MNSRLLLLSIIIIDNCYKNNSLYQKLAINCHPERKCNLSKRLFCELQVQKAGQVWGDNEQNSLMVNKILKQSDCLPFFLWWTQVWGSDMSSCPLMMCTYGDLRPRWSLYLFIYLLVSIALESFDTQFSFSYDDSILRSRFKSKFWEKYQSTFRIQTLSSLAQNLMSGVWWGGDV